MRAALSLTHVSSMAAASQVPLRQRLIAATKGQKAQIDVTGPVPASQIIGTYRVRLQLWERDVLPTMAGLREFVEAIDAAGDQPVSMAVYQEPNRRFVLLMSEDTASLL